MKKINFLIAAFVLSILFFGCQRFLDINYDPNHPSESRVDLVFPAAVENAASVIGGPYLILGEIWSQHWTSDINAPDYQNEDSYNITAGSFSYDNAGWSVIYPGALMDFEWVRKTAAEQKNWTYYLMATVMQSYVFQFLVDYYDQIPFSEAFQGTPPHFDNGDEVYDSLIARIDTALNRYLNNCQFCQEPDRDDLIFKGNMNAWVAFANTLKLKIYLREVYKRPDVAMQGIENLINSGVSFITVDVKFDDFADESGRDNYVYAREWRGRGNINLRASKTLIDYLKAFEDPRLDYLFVRPKGEEDTIINHRGVYQGDFRNVYSYPNTDPPEISRPRVTALTPMYFMTAEESYFLLAEAYLRLNDKTNAKEMYQKALEANFRRLMNLYKGTEIDTNEVLGDIDYNDVLNKENYGDFDETMPFDTLLKRIIVQKWIALTNVQGYETFLEHNRTGYPENSPVNPGDDDFQDEYVLGRFTVSVTGVLPPSSPYPKRLLFPSTEQSRNPYTPPVKPLYEPVWWDPESNYTAK